MTPALFSLLLVPLLIAIAAITIRTCQHISTAGRDVRAVIRNDVRAVIRNNAETRRNYSRAQEDLR